MKKVLNNENLCTAMVILALVAIIAASVFLIPPISQSCCDKVHRGVSYNTVSDFPENSIRHSISEWKITGRNQLTKGDDVRYLLYLENAEGKRSYTSVSSEDFASIQNGETCYKYKYYTRPPYTSYFERLSSWASSAWLVVLAFLTLPVVYALWILIKDLVHYSKKRELYGI